MNVEQIINDLCQNYGVSRAFGDRLRPLVERASTSPPEKRVRLLQLVERSFAEEARRVTIKPSQFLSSEELKVLRTVADILHAWDPPVWLKMWNRKFKTGGDAS